MKFISKYTTVAGSLVAILLTSACRAYPDDPPPAASVSPEQEKLVNTYSLLNDLLKQEQHVDKLLLMKLESDALDELIGRIADVSADAVRRLKAYAESDAALSLDQVNLPPGEVAVRKAIEETKREVLLKPFNDRFEFHLLLTQSEALVYGRHLCEVAATIDRNEERVGFLRELSKDLQSLHDDTLTLLRERIP